MLYRESITLATCPSKGVKSSFSVFLLGLLNPGYKGIPETGGSASYMHIVIAETVDKYNIM